MLETETKRLIIKTVKRNVKVNSNYGDFKSDLWSKGVCVCVYVSLSSWNKESHTKDYVYPKGYSCTSSRLQTFTHCLCISPNHFHSSVLPAQDTVSTLTKKTNANECFN